MRKEEHLTKKNVIQHVEKRRNLVLIRWRSKSDERAAAGIADAYRILKLVKSMLENSEPEEQTDGDHHQYDAHAQTANSRPTAHLEGIKLQMIFEYRI